MGVVRLHAAELGMHRLDNVIDTLLVLQKKHRIRFDIWQVVKRDHAIISFFDQVFDQGMNPVVPWTAYWTPLRYPLLINLARLFDDELAEKAWRAVWKPTMAGRRRCWGKSAAYCFHVSGCWAIPVSLKL